MNYHRNILAACGAVLRDPWYVTRYVSMGALSTAIQLGVFWIATSVFSLWYMTATVIAFLARSCFKFVLVRTWLFGKRIEGKTAHQLVQFFGLEVLYLGLGLALVRIGVEGIGIPPFVAFLGAGFLTWLMALILTRHCFKPY